MNVQGEETYMKKKVTGFVIAGIAVVVLVIIIVMQLALPDKYVVVDIPNISDVTKIKYTDVRGDVYDIEDKELIDEFILSVNQVEFTRDADFSNSSFSSETIELYDASENKVYGLHVINERAILIDGHSYEMDEEQNGMPLDMLSEKGEFVENIHK